MDKNIKLLDYMFHGYESSILGYYKMGNEAVLIFSDITSTMLCRITFKNVLINENVADRLAFDLEDAIDCVNSGNIEILSAEYGKQDDGKYFFKVELAQIPERYFNYAKLEKIKTDFYGEIFEERECPIMSFLADEIYVELFEKIEKIND